MAVDEEESGLLARAGDVLSTAELNNILVDPNVSWRLLERTREQQTIQALQAAVWDLLTSGPSKFRIPIDLESRYVCPARTLGEPALPGVPIPEQRNQTIAIEAALCELRRINSIVHHFVNCVTSRIVARLDPQNAGSFSSGSFRLHAGMTVLVNTHVLEGNVYRLIDAIVHEAIHAALYMYEPLVTLLCAPSAKELQIDSPWTGRTLNIDQFVQACFVWWGLANLWTQSSKADKNDESERLRLRATRGFRADPIRILHSYADDGHIESRTMAALSVIENAVPTVMDSVSL